MNLKCCLERGKILLKPHWSLLIFNPRAFASEQWKTKHVLPHKIPVLYPWKVFWLELPPLQKYQFSSSSSGGSGH